MTMRTMRWMWLLLAMVSGLAWAKCDPSVARDYAGEANEWADRLTYHFNGAGSSGDDAVVCFHVRKVDALLRKIRSRLVVQRDFFSRCSFLDDGDEVPDLLDLLKLQTRRGGQLDVLARQILATCDSNGL